MPPSANGHQILYPTNIEEPLLIPSALQKYPFCKISPVIAKSLSDASTQTIELNSTNDSNNIGILMNPNEPPASEFVHLQNQKKHAALQQHHSPHIMSSGNEHQQFFSSNAIGIATPIAGLSAMCRKMSENMNTASTPTHSRHNSGNHNGSVSSVGPMLPSNISPNGNTYGSYFQNLNAVAYQQQPTISGGMLISPESAMAYHQQQQQQAFTPGTLDGVIPMSCSATAAATSDFMPAATMSSPIGTSQYVHQHHQNFFANNSSTQQSQQLQSTCTSAATAFSY